MSPPPLLPLPFPARVRPSPPRVSSLFVNRRALLPVNPACTYYVEEQDRANPPDLKTNLPHRPPSFTPSRIRLPPPYTSPTTAADRRRVQTGYVGLRSGRGHCDDHVGRHRRLGYERRGRLQLRALHEPEPGGWVVRAKRSLSPNDQYGHTTATFVFVGGTPDRSVTSRWIPGHVADRGFRRAPPRCPR